MVKKHRNKIILGIVGIVVAGYFPKAHPFSGFKGKTLWDWLSLAGVPMSLAGLGFWLQIQQQQRNEEQLQEEILQNYYDKVWLYRDEYAAVAGKCQLIRQRNLNRWKFLNP